jgi:predicted alpha/beta-fold hydrolase
MLAVGISLGGNALLRYLGEEGRGAASSRGRVGLGAAGPGGGGARCRGFNMIYTRMFLQTLKRKSLAKLDQYPGLFDRDAMLAAATCTRSTTSSPRAARLPRHRRLLGARLQQADARRDRRPTLVLNARNDPFLPALPARPARRRHVLLEQPAHGGHVGFMTPRGGLLGPCRCAAGHIEWLPGAS